MLSLRGISVVVGVTDAECHARWYVGKHVMYRLDLCAEFRTVKMALEEGVRACSGETFFGLKPRRAAGEFGSTSLPVALSVVGSDE